MRNLANNTSGFFATLNRENNSTPVHFSRTDGETEGGNIELTFDTTAWSA